MCWWGEDTKEVGHEISMQVGNTSFSTMKALGSLANYFLPIFQHTALKRKPVPDGGMSEILPNNYRRSLKMKITEGNWMEVTCAVFHLHVTSWKMNHLGSSTKIPVSSYFNRGALGKQNPLVRQSHGIQLSMAKWAECQRGLRWWSGDINDDSVMARKGHLVISLILLPHKSVCFTIDFNNCKSASQKSVTDCLKRTDMGWDTIETG